MPYCFVCFFKATFLLHFHNSNVNVIIPHWHCFTYRILGSLDYSFPSDFFSFSIFVCLLIYITESCKKFWKMARLMINSWGYTAISIWKVTWRRRRLFQKNSWIHPQKLSITFIFSLSTVSMSIHSETRGLRTGPGDLIVGWLLANSRTGRLWVCIPSRLDCVIVFSVPTWSA